MFRSCLVNITKSKYKSQLKRIIVTSRHYSTHGNILSKGIAGIVGLHEPDDWKRLANESIDECDKIVAELSHHRKYSRSEVVKLLDKLSDTLCRVADPAEAMFELHPNICMANSAADASMLIEEKINEYNTYLVLFEATEYALECPYELSDEELVVAKQLKIEFLHQGLLLPEDKKSELLELRCRLQNLIIKYRRNLSSRKDNDQNLIVKHLEKILQVRHNMANLLGFENYNDYYAWHRDLKNSNDIQDFLLTLLEKLRPKLDVEKNKLIQQFPNESSLDLMREIYTSKKSNIDEAMREYFSLDTVLRGIFEIFDELFGIVVQVDRQAQSEMWHASVFKLNFLEKDTYSLIGSVYCDLYSHKRKNNEATIPLRFHSQWFKTPSVILSLKFPIPTSQVSPLLSYSQVHVLFHEFGHVLQAILSKNELQHFSGTRGLMDHIETASQLFQHFETDYRILKRFAIHHQTGQVLPEQLFKRYLDEKAEFSAIRINHQIVLALVDQQYHSRFIEDGNSTSIYRDIVNKYGYEQFVEGSTPQTEFGHLVGYGSTYYSYLYSGVHSSQIWNSLFEADPVNPTSGMIYRNKFLAYGGLREPREMLFDITGKKMDLNYFVSDVIKGIDQ